MNKENATWRKLIPIMAVAALLLMPVGAFAAEHAARSGHSVSSKSFGTKSVGVKSHPTNFGTKNYTKHIGTQNYTKQIGTKNYTKHIGTQNYTKQIGTKNYTKHIGKKSGRHHYSHRRHFYNGIWWSYGVGSCWAYDDYWEEWYWTCGDY